MTPVLMFFLLLMDTATGNRSEPCRLWQAKVSALTESEKKTLEGAGAVYTSDSIVISDKVVSNCQARLGIGRYIYDAIAGHVSEEDRRFALAHSSQIRTIIESIWPGLSNNEVINDGARGEIYTAILYLRQPDRLRLARKVLAYEGPTLPLVDIVIRGNLTELGPELLQIAKAADNKNQQIYALATLAALRNPKGTEGLSRLLSTHTLSPQQAQVAEKILLKSKSNRKITSEDLLDLEYEP